MINKICAKSNQRIIFSLAQMRLYEIWTTTPTSNLFYIPSGMCPLTFCRKDLCNVYSMKKSAIQHNLKKQSLKRSGWTKQWSTRTSKTMSRSSLGECTPIIQVSTLILYLIYYQFGRFVLLKRYKKMHNQNNQIKRVFIVFIQSLLQCDNKINSEDNLQPWK